MLTSLVLIGKPTGCLPLKGEYPRPNLVSLRHLYEFRSEIQKRLASGPWDQWDQAAYEECLRLVQQQISCAELTLEIRLDELESLEAAVNEAKSRRMAS